MDVSSQVANEHLGIGTETWVSVAELEQEHTTRSLSSQLYGSFTYKPLRRCLANLNLAILHPSKASTFPSSTVVTLEKRFPQLGLSDSESIQRLEEEFMDFTLSPGDLPTIDTYNAVDHTKKACAGHFWLEVGKMMILSG